MEKKFNFVSNVLKILLLAVFIFSATLYFMKTPGCRFLFRFESVDKGKSSLEYRILPHRKGDEAISLYVDELLLGPKTERARPIFSLGTESKFCFLREKTLFVNLSGELLYRTGNAGEIMDGIELFKKNIFKSFPKVKSVEIFIDGKKILDNFPTFSED